MKFLSNIDLNSNQLQNSLFHLLATDPVSPVEGQFWYNTTSHLHKYYSNSTVIAVYQSLSTNTASTNVLRDSSGNFSANIGTFASLTISGTPTASTDAATKGYVDTVAQGLSAKPSAKLATTAAMAANTYSNGTSGVGATLTATGNGALTVDSVAVTVADYILVKNEASGLKNGLYKVTATGDGSNPYVLTRAVEMDQATEIDGAFVFVEAGTVNASTGWVSTNTGTFTLGTTAMTWTQFSGAGSYSVTAPIALTGTTISINLSARLVNNGGNLDLQASVATPGTYSSVTVDTYGRVTTGADISTSNGLVTRTSSGTFTSRTVTGTSNRVTITNGDGVAGNPTIDIHASYVGQSSIITLGTITTGVWTGTSIAVANGGTGSGTASAARTALSAAGLYNGSLTGDGSTVAFTITHNLNNRQAIVMVLDSGYNEVLVDTQNNAVNTTVVTFALAPANTLVYYVTVIG